jgi:hypothetical protein
MGFSRASVTARRLNIAHEDPHGHGPFCRLMVEDAAPDSPGVYAWVAAEHVMYVGKASRLLCITQGARHGRPYNDYTYVPASQCRNGSDPRVRVNGLINAVLSRTEQVEWWWLQQPSLALADALERHLIDSWQPPWNRMGIRPVES